MLCSLKPIAGTQAKDKEQAVLQLYRIYGLEPVIFDNLRPEEPSSLPTKGRKTTRRKGNCVKDEIIPVLTERLAALAEDGGVQGRSESCGD